ncbi:MAG: hypothetical protein WBF77_02980 [Sulfurimonadaceae bacterium]
MHEEQLFEMVNEAIIFAKNELKQKQELKSFAMVLFKNGYIESVTADEESHDNQYEALVISLRQRVSDEPKITGLAIIAKVNIPALYKPPVDDGIRIHLEERHKADNKIGARFLYVPYQLYKGAGSDEITMQLLDPIPVAIPQEIFTK